MDHVTLPDLGVLDEATAGGLSGGAIFAVVAGVIVVSILGGYYVTRGVLALAARTDVTDTDDTEPHDTEPHEPEHPTVEPSERDNGPTGAAAVAALRGGTWIGILERLSVTCLILVGYPAGIAILVAIKGLGRYPELQANPGASERFVVGTLASIVWAAALGVLGLWWIG